MVFQNSNAEMKKKTDRCLIFELNTVFSDVAFFISAMETLLVNSFITKIKHQK